MVQSYNKNWNATQRKRQLHSPTPIIFNKFNLLDYSKVGIIQQNHFSSRLVLFVIETINDGSGRAIRFDWIG